MIVKLPANTPVDIYDATGFTVGVALNVTNTGTGDVRLSTSEAGLSNDYDVIPPYGFASNDVGDDGAWASSSSGSGINVTEA